MNVVLEKGNTPAKAGEVLSNMLKDCRDNTILLMLSGGSAFELLEFFDSSLLGKHITISVLDERLSADPTINNFAQLKQTSFYNTAVEQGCSFIDTEMQPNDNLESLRNRFQKAILSWRKKYENGIIIATLGIGTDMHIAGTMPYPEDEALFKDLFEDTDSIFVSYDAGEKNKYPLRITPTNHFLRSGIDHALVYVVGVSKKQSLSRTLMTKELLHRSPSRIIHKMKNVTLVTDIEL